MSKKTTEALAEFQRAYFEKGRAPAEQVIALLDLIKKDLGLEMVYVCTNSAATRHFLYEYCSHGPGYKAMHYNLLLEDQDHFALLNDCFRQANPAILTRKESDHTLALAAGNLSYAWMTDQIFSGFISFQGKDGSWTLADLEAIKGLAEVLWPLVRENQLQEEVNFKELFEDEGSLAWVYPKLGLIVFSAELRRRYDLSNYYRYDTVDEFAQNFMAYGDTNRFVAKYRECLQGGRTSVTVHGFNLRDQFKVDMFVNRRDEKGEPEQVVGLIHKLELTEAQSRERDKRLLAYNNFKQAISKDDLFELLVDFDKNELTIFKYPVSWQKILGQDGHYDQFHAAFAESFVPAANRYHFLYVLDRRHLQQRLSIQQSMFMTTHVQLDGGERLLEIEAIRGTTGEHQVPKTAVLIAKDISNKRVLRYDQLTGLLNMHNFLLETEAVQSEQPAAAGHLLALNIDKFKLYNIQNGLQAGDGCLLEIAAIIKDVYPHALTARFSADNFYIYDTDPKGWQERILLLQEHLRQSEYASSLRVRVGVYEYVDQVSAEVACDRAKLACDCLKTDPQARWYIYTDDLQKSEELKQYLINNLDEAIEKKHLEVYYQPVIRALTRRLCSAEALIRWNDPVKGFLSPGQFIPLFEEMNLSYKVDRYVIEEVTAMLRARLDKQLPVVPVSINLSRADFQMMDPLQVLNRAVEKQRLPKRLIHVEITESALAKDVQRLKQAIHDFRQAGYQVWMDDFGSGYSSLNYLKNFEFDEIKLDMVFMSDFDEASKKILASCVKMSKSLGIHTLAEGVETQEQFDFLREIGCERIQGYYFSQPLPLDELTWLLEKEGIEIEDGDQDQFYQQVGLTDVISDRPVSLILDDGESFKTVYMNQLYKRELEESGKSIHQISDDLANAPESSISLGMRALADRAGKGNGEQSEYLADVRHNGQYIRLSVTSIAQLRNWQMLLVNASDITFQGNVQISK